MTHVDHEPSRDDATSSSGARLFPIGFGLGAIAALALFFGYRAVAPDAGGPGPSPVPAPAASGVIETDTVAAAADELPVTEPANDAGAYTASAPDVAAAMPDAPDLAGLEALASLNGGAGLGEPGDDVSGPTTFVTGTRLPSIDDPETTDLFGGAVMMVSSSVPRVIVLADGTSLVTGGTLPGGHRIVDIRRERILLERDGVEWRVRIP